MIRRIESLQKFGIFRDFVGNEASGLPAFNRFNLIYGWNYSGKTTLSRLFQVLESPESANSFPSSSFCILLDDESSITRSNLTQAPRVRVFNRDYVTQNFRQEHTAPAVFIVGKESAELRARLVQLQSRHTRIEKLVGQLESSRNVLDAQLAKAGTDTARKIRDLLGDARFERPRLERRVTEVRPDVASYILADPVVQAQLATLRSTEGYAELSQISPGLPDLATLAGEVNALLGQTASNRAIEELKRDLSLESWVRQGLTLHQDADMCAFCNSPLTATRLEALREHFSKAYEDLLRTLEQKVSLLSALILNVTLPDEMRLMPEPRASFPEIAVRINDWCQWATSVRNQLVTALNQKRSSVETSGQWSGDLSRASEAEQLLHELKDVIERHNALVRSIEQAKADAKLALERHYAALHLRENDIEQKEQEVAALQGKAKRGQRLQEGTQSAIRIIQQQISQASIGAEKLNQLLRYILADSNIAVESVGDSEFRFLRGEEVATNLSDGEKTALTLAYFFTSLEANGAILADTIVFVDDPVSSLDSNHIYAVFALICERLEGSHQLFISTHNSEFFNLLKNRWLNSRSKLPKQSSAYYAARVLSPEGEAHGLLTDLPPLLRKYNSEYEFLFLQLRNFAVAPAPSEHEAYTSPNLLRKFLEAYLGFQRPSITAWHDKLDLLFDSAEQRMEVHKFADDASHLQSLSRALRHPAFISSAQQIIKDVLAALEAKDSGHYKSLLEAVDGKAHV